MYGYGSKEAARIMGVRRSTVRALAAQGRAVLRTTGSHAQHDGSPRIPVSAPGALFLEPWIDIYETDEERVMSFEDTAWFSESLKEVYRACGYTLVEVPRGSVDERATFVRTMIARWADKGNLGR